MAISENLLDAVRSDLMKLSHQVDLQSSSEGFSAVIQQLNLVPDDFMNLATFSENGYASFTLFENEMLTARLCCWLSGQFSSIHGHNRSLCGIWTIDGTIENRCFDRPTKSCKTDVLVSDTLVVLDRDAIHQIVNTADRHAVTLHLYAPKFKGNQQFDASLNPLPVTNT
jgi:hypothetical protein